MQSAPGRRSLQPRRTDREGGMGNCLQHFVDWAWALVVITMMAAGTLVFGDTRLWLEVLLLFWAALLFWVAGRIVLLVLDGEWGRPEPPRSRAREF